MWTGRYIIYIHIYVLLTAALGADECMPPAQTAVAFIVFMTQTTIL